MISEITIYRYRTEFEGDLELRAGGKVVYTGEATTDLDPGSYTVTLDRHRKLYVVEKPRPKSQERYRFVLDVNDIEDPFTLSYASRIRLTIVREAAQRPIRSRKICTGLAQMRTKTTHSTSTT